MEKYVYERLATAISENARLTEAALVDISAGEDEDYGLVLDAQRYSLLDGGKRVRPFLVNGCCALLNGDINKSMPLACAVEMIHTYSLIHDDLPCMDDDDFRRGKPSNHKEFGYANALLAGDALLTKAFLAVAKADSLSAEERIEAVRLISEAAGDSGMIGGQIIDLAGETVDLNFETLLKLHSHKTGALIECSVRLGCLAAGHGEDSPKTKMLCEYAKNIGLAFQVIDDVLDYVSSEEALGKSVGSDATHNKTTFLTFYSVDEAKAFAAELTQKAISVISELEGSEVLTDFACYLLERQK